MSEEKECNWIADDTFCPTAELHFKKAREQLQTAKEENEKLTDKINFFEKYTDIEKEFRLNIASILNCAEGTEPLTIAIKTITQQNKQMREAINKALHFECEICPYYNTEKCGNGEIKICDEAMEFILEQALGEK